MKAEEKKAATGAEMQNQRRKKERERGLVRSVQRRYVLISWDERGFSCFTRLFSVAKFCFPAAGSRSQNPL
jgi:hypothetical protein